MSRNQISIIDVAKAAGVSSTTVSHVLNKTRFVSKETSDKVYKAVNDLHYIPNASARTLKTGKSQKIEFIVSDIDNIFFTSLIETIERYLAESGYQLLLANTHEDWEKEKNFLNSISRSSIDGLILSTSQTDFSILQANLPDLPTILIDRRPPGCSLDSVTISTYKAVYRAVIRLHLAGHDRIGMIGARTNLSTSIERNKAYKEAMEDLGLKTYFIPGDSLRNSSPAHYKKLVELGCTAIIIANERMSEDIILYRYKNPDEMKRKLDLVSFIDNEEAILTSRAILQPTDQMGKYASERILRMINNPKALPIEKDLEATYLEKLIVDRQIKN